MASKSRELSPRQKEEIFGILLMMLGVLILISLLSYHSNEQPLGLNMQPVNNALGVAGVYVSYLLITVLLGYPAIAVPFLIVAWGWNRFRGIDSDRLARITVYTLGSALYVATILAMPDFLTSNRAQVGFTMSGLVGGFIATQLTHVVGVAGAIIVLVAIAMVVIIAVTDISLAEGVAMLSGRIHAIREWVARKWNMLRLRLETAKKVKEEKSYRQPVLAGSGHAGSPEMMPSPIVEAPPEMPDWKKRLTAMHRLEEEAATQPPAPPFMTEPPGDANGGIRIDTPIRLDSQPALDQDDEAPYTAPRSAYKFPSLELLERANEEKAQTRDELLANAKILEERLADFDVQGRVVEINPGPVITRYEYEPAAGVKISKITALADDLALAMRAKRIRIVAPIPGKAAVGVELPNREPQVVALRSIIDSEKFHESASPMSLALGKTIAGHPYVTSLDRMPHLLIAGSTGSGKSVCLNTIIASILYKAHPSDLQFVMVDPKRLELSTYKRLRHHHLTYRDDLNEEVVTTAQNALAVLKSLEWEMENRYDYLAHAGVRNIEEYNRRIAEGKLPATEEMPHEKLPYIVLIIDELADLMLTAAKEVEEPIARLTQMSRAIGIHLIVATQRPSVDVITGVIKANFPARIAFQVASKVDSRTILDMNGAEKLLGRGDMLFLPPGSPEAIRLHNAFISSEETERIIDHVRRQPRYDKKTLPIRTEGSAEDAPLGRGNGERDELFNEALKLVVRHQQGSISLLQRRLKIGYSRAARLIDELEAAGYVGGFDGSKARDVLINEEQLQELGIE
jgi:S-DNA-T family DNA segregation ATPase FtsK/SpoIIIE